MTHDFSLMTSSQTKDGVTLAAGEHVVVDAPQDTVCLPFRPPRIVGRPRRLRDEFDSNVPKTLDDLHSPSSVGPKVAFRACMQPAWNMSASTYEVSVFPHANDFWWKKRGEWHKPSCTPYY